MVAGGVATGVEDVKDDAAGVDVVGCGVVVSSAALTSAVVLELVVSADVDVVASGVVVC